jgi:PQQ-dependent dehydrogenase (methanol/ethanol family)
MVILVTIAVLAAVAQQNRQVDDVALREAGTSGEEWITYNINWAEQRHSALTQINTNNVRRLGLAFSYDIPTLAAQDTRQEATPLIFDGVLYSITPWSVVFAVDARTGKEIWRQDPQVNQQIWRGRICCGVVNRGIALYQGKVIAPVVDGRLRALELKTGKVVWETRVSPETMPYTITMAPRVIRGGKVIVGVSGGEYGIRGFFSAYDAETGEIAWRFYTVPGDPSKPFEHPDLEAAAKTWDKSKEWWKIGGGAAVWGGITYDADTDTVFVSTGQPAPWTSVNRGEGDALYSNCIIAVRGATGKLLWYFQTVPGDDWDLDSIADMTLADLTINGRLRKVIMHAPKSGFFYVLDRNTGELLAADPFVTVTWAAGWNLQTGRAIVNPEARYGTDASITVIPGPAGGHLWPPMSFNPSTGLVYIPSTMGTGFNFQANPNYVPAPTEIGPTGRGQMNMGTGGGGGGRGGGGGGGARGGAPPAPLAPGLDPATGPAPAGAAGAGRGAPAGGAAAGGGRGGGAAAPAGPPTPAKMLFLTLDGAPIVLPPPPAPPAAAAAGAAGGGGGGAAPAGGAPGGAPAGGAPAAGGGGGRGGGGGGGGGRGGGPAIPAIGPQGRGNFVIAWDPVAQKERWRGPAGSSASTSGGTLSTAGNLLFSSVQGRLLAFNAATGELLHELQTGLNGIGPPMTYMIDGKQYIVVSGGAPGGGGGGGRGGGGAAAAPAAPAAIPPAAPAPAGNAGGGRGRGQ